MSIAVDRSGAATRAVTPPRRPTVVASLAVAALVIGAVALAYAWGLRAALQERRVSAEHQLELYALGLQSELARYEYLPTVLAANREIVALLAQPGQTRLVDAVNRHLERINADARTSALYALDLAGVVRAASNWNQPASFVGRDLSFRPYVADALAGRQGRFYGIGTTSSVPGYYFSHAIRDADRLVGVAAVKVDLDRLEKIWSGASDQFLVTDPDGVVVLSSQRDWKFRTIAPLSAAAGARIRRERQFENVSLQPLDLATESSLDPNAAIVRLAAAAGDPPRRYLAASRPLADPGWRVMVLWDLAPAQTAAAKVAAIAALAALLLILLLLHAQDRRRALAEQAAAKFALERAYDDLERKVVERTADLTAANEQLKLEAEQRQRNERVLRKAQDALVHAGKLAAIGQMASGVTHELNQPLAALRTLSDNARVFLERGNAQAAAGNLALVGELIERMGRITRELKNFSRKSTPQLGAVDVTAAIGNALFLVEHRIRSEGVEVRRPPPQRLPARCDRERLEQVLVNLCANAIDAMKGAPVRRLEIAAAEQAGRVVLSVRDTGPGIAPEVAARLFEPFFTTKSAGAGLGLGLAISAGIVRDFGGSLRAGNHPGGGAVFTVELLATTEASDV